MWLLLLRHLLRHGLLLEGSSLRLRRLLLFQWDWLGEDAVGCLERRRVKGILLVIPLVVLLVIPLVILLVIPLVIPLVEEVGLLGCEVHGLVLVGLIGEAGCLFLEGGCHLGRVCLVLVLVGIGRHHLLVELVAVHVKILGRCIHAANCPADAGTHTAEFIGDGLRKGLLFVEFVDGLVGIF